MRISGETQTESDFRAIECIVAGLIADGLVKGYIANNVGVMLSKTDPFPAMNVSSS